MNTLKANGVTLSQVSEDSFLVIIKNLFIALSYWFKLLFINSMFSDSFVNLNKS